MERPSRTGEVPQVDENPEQEYGLYDHSLEDQDAHASMLLRQSLYHILEPSPVLPPSPPGSPSSVYSRPSGFEEPPALTLPQSALPFPPRQDSYRYSEEYQNSSNEDLATPKAAPKGTAKSDAVLGLNTTVKRELGEDEKIVPRTVYNDPRARMLPFMQPSKDGWTANADQTVETIDHWGPRQRHLSRVKADIAKQGRANEQESISSWLTPRGTGMVGGPKVAHGRLQNTFKRQIAKSRARLNEALPTQPTSLRLQEFGQATGHQYHQPSPSRPTHKRSPALSSKKFDKRHPASIPAALNSPLRTVSSAADIPDEFSQPQSPATLFNRPQTPIPTTPFHRPANPVLTQPATPVRTTPFHRPPTPVPTLLAAFQRSSDSTSSTSSRVVGAISPLGAYRSGYADHSPSSTPRLLGAFEQCPPHLRQYLNTPPNLRERTPDQRVHSPVRGLMASFHAQVEGDPSPDDALSPTTPSHDNDSHDRRSCDKSADDQHHVNRSSTDQPRGSRSSTDQPRGSRPPSDHHRGSQPSGEYHTGDTADKDESLSKLLAAKSHTVEHRGEYKEQRGMQTPTPTGELSTRAKHASEPWPQVDSTDPELATTDLYGNPLPHRVLRAQSEPSAEGSRVTKWPAYTQANLEKLWGEKGILGRPDLVDVQKKPVQKKPSMLFKEVTNRIKQTGSNFIKRTSNPAGSSARTDSPAVPPSATEHGKTSTDIAGPSTTSAPHAVTAPATTCTAADADLVESSSNAVMPTDAPIVHPEEAMRRFPISLSRGQQMRLYSELEHLLQSVANDFLMNEVLAGHLSVGSVQRMARQWANKGRPQVVELYFNLGTQRELALANADNLRFHGSDGNLAGRKHVLFHAWKDVARELALHTFCSADSAVRKVLCDAYIMLDMMGASGHQLLLLQRWHLDATETMEAYQGLLREEDEQRVRAGVTRQVMATTPLTSGPAEETLRGTLER